MKTKRFSEFVLESDSSGLPNEVKLAKMGLSPGIPVLEWWADVKAEDSALLTVFFIQRYSWPESSEDDMMAEKTFDSRSSRGFIEKRMMQFAQSGGMDWVHDMERDVWKRVNL